jgi:hypothetical protein
MDCSCARSFSVMEARPGGSNDASADSRQDELIQRVRSEFLET